MSSPHCRVRAATAVLLLSSFAGIADQALTENQRSRMGIIVSPDQLNSMQITPWQHPLFKEAFADFTKHLTLVSGAAFDIPPNDVTGYVRIGRAALVTAELKAEAAALTPGAYVIRTHGNDVLVFGREDVGDISGMYGFLREFAGVEFMGQNEAFHVVPRKDIVLPDAIDITVVPSFLTRRHGGSHHPKDPGYLYGVRCGNFCQSYQYELAPNHSYYRILHPAIYRKEHPEYYALWEGKRADPGPTDHQWQLCLSNPDVINHMIAEARKAFADDRRLCYEIVPNDSMQICQCENCRKLVPPGGSESDLFMSCINQVAKALAEEFPDRYIGILAYGVTNTPPLGEIEPNVFIGYTPDYSQWYDKVFREQELSRMRQWQSRVRDNGKKHPAGWHAYESGGCMLPRYFPHHYADTMKRMYNEFDVVAYSGDILVGFWPWTGPQNYLISRLLWDITLDPDAVLDHYFTTLYGPAATPIEAFYGLLEKRYFRTRSGGRWLKDWGWGIDPIYLYSAADVKHLRAYLAKAGKLAKDSPEVRRRIDYLSEKTAPILDMMETFSISRRLNSGRELPRVKDVERCIDVLATLEERWKQLIMSDPSLCQYSVEDIGSGTRQAWQRLVEGELAPAVATLLQARPDNREVQALYRKFAVSELQKAKVAVARGAAKLGDNTLQNPGFEARGSEHPDGPDWRASGLLNWSYWTQAPQDRLGISTDIKRSGQQSAFINAAGGECYIALVPLDVADGKRTFRIDGYLYRTDANTSAKIEVAWQNDQEGRLWRYAGYSTMDLTACNQWEHVELIVEAPAEAQRGQVMLWAESTAASAPVYFDDISFTKVSLPKEAE
jgi:hypothetical protein